MTRIARRIFIPGCLYHIYNRGNNRNRIFRGPKDKEYFIERLKKYAKIENVEIVAFCIMDNHFHIAIIPGKNSDVSKMMQRLCTGYSILFNKKYLHVGHVFQSRFKSKYIQTERGVENVLNYIANNPVKKGYSDCPENYAWLWVRDRP